MVTKREIKLDTSAKSLMVGRLKDRLSEGCFEVSFTKTHAKFVVMTNAEFNIVVLTSANFNENKRMEFFQIRNDRAVANYLLEISADIATLTDDTAKGLRKLGRDDKYCNYEVKGG